MTYATERRLVVAMDHGRAMGALAGIENPGRVIDTVLDAGADGLLISFGLLKRYRERLADRVPLFLRLDGGASILKEPWLENEAWSLLHSVEEARLLGAHGVCAMYFMAARCELETLEIVAGVAGECLEHGLPLMVEALPCPNPKIANTLAARHVAKKALDGVDAHGLIEPRAVAARFAGVIADPPVHGRQRIVAHEVPPRLFEATGLGQGQPALNVLARRAGIVAGRQ